MVTEACKGYQNPSHEKKNKKHQHAHERYRSLYEEEKQKKRQYYREHHKNLSEGKKKITECRRNYYITHKKQRPRRIMS